MDNIKNDKYYLEKILENVNSIIKYTNGLSYDEFIEGEMVIDAPMFRLVQIAEKWTCLTTRY